MAHRPISAHLFTLDGNVLSTGGAKNLAKGQFTIVNTGKPTVNGAAVVGDFAGLSNSTIYEMRLGKHKIPNSRTNANSKPYSSQTFKIADVVDVRANFPKHTKQVFDDVVIGYDGVNAGTEISLLEGQTTLMDIALCGENIAYMSGSYDHVIKIHFGREVGDTDKDVIERAVARLRRETFPGGTPVTEAIDIKVVNSDNLPLAGVPYVFSKLNLTDTGDSNSLGLVQAQYPLYRVELTGRDGLVSEYTILHPASVSLANYTFSKLAYVKDCAACEAGYTLLSESAGTGVIYSVSLEDDGVNQVALAPITGIPGFVSATREGQDGSNAGRGIYSVVLDNALTDAEITAYATTAGIQSTAILTLQGTVKEICEQTTAATSVAWVDGATCYASTEAYTIQLKDDDCSGSRLAELQAYYPTLVIESGAASGNATQAVTLAAGATTGNLVITVNGVDYTTANTGTAAGTATAFVAAHAATILTATGAVVTNPSSGVVLFTDAAEGFPSITIADSTLTTLANTTVGALDQVTVATAGGCQAVYSTTVVTNLVCEECDDIYLQGFTSTAPADFDFHSWEKVEEPIDADAKMGIRLTGKPFIILPTDISSDQIPFAETSCTINVSGGYTEEVNFSFDPQYSDIFNVVRLSRKQDRDSLGYHLLALENQSKTFFDGETNHVDNLYAKHVLGEESVLKFDKQYVQYAVTIHDSKYSQSQGRRSDMGIEYSIWVELGKHANVENYINKLAVKAGLDPVQAVAN